MNSTVLTSNPNHINPYGYTPTRWICILVIILYAISTAIHVAQAVFYKKWYLLFTAVFCGLAECIGWSGRLWSSFGPRRLTPFLMQSSIPIDFVETLSIPALVDLFPQISTTIFAPTFLAAANFIIFGTVIDRLGPEYSRLPSRLYAVLFVSFDLVALIIQAIGGGTASKEAQSISGNAENGGHIMLAGIIMQLIEMVVYVILAGEFFLNYRRRKPVRTPKESERRHLISSSPSSSPNTTPIVEGEYTSNSPQSDSTINRGPRQHMSPKLRLMVFGIIFSTILLFIRAVYRTIELSDGWTGRIIHTQRYFNILDGAMVILAMYTLNVLHPGVLLRREDHESGRNRDQEKRAYA